MENMPQGFEFLGNARDFADDIHEIFSKVPLLEAFDATEVELLCNFMVCYAAPRDTVLLRQGEVGEFMFFVLTGHVDVFVRTPEGRVVPVAQVGPGAALGDMSMIDRRSRSASCVAADPVDMVVLTHTAFKDIMLTLPRLGNKLLLLFLHTVTDRMHRMQDEFIKNKSRD